MRLAPGVALARSAVRGQARATCLKGMTKSLGYLMNEAYGSGTGATVPQKMSGYVVSKRGLTVAGRPPGRKGPSQWTRTRESLGSGKGVCYGWARSQDPKTAGCRVRNAARYTQKIRHEQRPGQPWQRWG